MSLTLREKTQPVLDQHGLQNYHIGLNESKGMVIKGECGNPLITVKGVTFSRHDPTLKEIQYSIELLDAFLAKHLSIIKKVMDKKKANSEMKELRFENFVFSRYGVVPHVTYKTDKDYAIEFSADGKVEISIKFDSLKEANAFKIPKDIADKAAKMLQNKEDMDKASEELGELNQELNRCAI